jgi:predicted tellurium resistance membrane protein TerC
MTRMDWITNPEIWIALVTLTVLEIVLGIDNIIFISIVSSKLPADEQPRARKVGLALAMGTRILLLLGLSWLVHLTDPLFHIASRPFSGRDLILLFGGLFLLYKATHEIHEKMEGDEHEEAAQATKAATFGQVIVSIAILDIVFSLDSVITAVGMVDQVPVMIAAIIIAVGTMMLAAESISAFVENHPTVKMLALSFLLLIGLSLVGEGLGHHIPKPYIYFSMAFSALVETLNIRSNKARKKAASVQEPTLS